MTEPAFLFQHPATDKAAVATTRWNTTSSYVHARHSPNCVSGAAGAAGLPLPLVGRVVSEANREGSFLPHSNIDPRTRTRAKKLRTELTEAEAAMWNMLRDFRARGARFRRETPIGPYIADFAWLSARIVVEVDGDSHETLSGRKHDIRRDNFLKSQGFTVHRFDNAQVIDGPEFVFLTIEQAIAGSLKKEPSQ
ncbi:endonuclease domain-containing protein [Pararhizobium sp. A13]|uniref:endonuclease domain-containing protein n=1 Tax=Pararhizobium sp. A13 TaxID=3133975 RepID=UPI0032532753